MSLSLKPTHATVKAYYETLHDVQLHFDHEGAVRGAFQTLLTKCGQRTDPKLTLIAEYPYKRGRSTQLRIDGALVDLYKLPHGYWEAKDEKDDLAKEVQSKLDKGYPSDNTIFQAPERAILYQGGTRIFDEDITRPDALVSVVNQFFEYKAPDIQEWLKAVDEFSARVPELSQQVESLIKEERRRNPSFRNVFDDFYALCRQAINPNLSEEAVERMLVQHLLTERIFRKIFNNSDFSHRNVVAAEIEKVIGELTKRSLNRDDFLKKLEPFYHAIERNAENATDYTAKQDFLNTVYMRFFQGYSPKEADTHGIVYTPQPIVNFMVRSVEEILQKEFGRSLSDKGVHILDPFVGTGNFITRIMQEIKTTDLPYKYEHELHCNEVMLLPYYIASMNIEHAYYERVGEYRAFPGICLVDTFELAEAEQASLGFMTEENAERVKRQKQSPIFVIIGNPPYNAWQVNENDNNRNRNYPDLDTRIATVYARGSEATNKIALSDPYVKAFMWASDRLGKEGIVAFVSNNGFLDGVAFDGMREDLSARFAAIYHLNLKGNARTSGDRRQREGGNIFDDQIRVGVGITLLVKKESDRTSACRILVHSVEDYLPSEKKRGLIEDHSSVSQIEWEALRHRARDGWSATTGPDASDLPLMGNTEGKKGSRETGIVFQIYSRGAETTRDSWVYNFSARDLTVNVTRMIETYNMEVDRWTRSPRKDVDAFVVGDDRKIKWSSRLKELLQTGVRTGFHEAKIRRALYRPFTAEFLYFDDVLNHRRGRLPESLPNPQSERENVLIVTSDIASRSSFSVLVTSIIPDLHLCAGVDAFQCFPFYTYAEDGTHRRENITDWALDQFRSHYADLSISKWDIFHYVYAVLHHPDYRERYAANLRRELPRIPFVGTGAEALNNSAAPDAGLKPGSSTDPTIGATAESASDARTTVEERPFKGRAEKRRKESNSTLPKAVAGERSSQATGSATEQRYDRLSDSQKDAVLDEIKRMQDAGELIPTRLRYFRAFVKAGQRLAEIHVNYESQPEYPLTKIEKTGEKLDYRVEKMKLSKDKTQLVYNKFLTLADIPPETFEYRLGNRSALEWIIDQYQVSTDKRSGITNDPNREDDPTYILRLVGQVVTVSLETVKIVKALPEFVMA